jgi:predicted small metal-binding protein
MTCKQLGGACDLEFRANSFQEIAEMSKRHGMEMYQKGEPAHLKAMQEMQQMMQSQEKMQQWMEDKRKEFEASPEV